MHAPRIQHAICNLDFLVSSASSEHCQLNENYTSGIEDCPGAQFVIHLNTPPVELDAITADTENSSGVSDLCTEEQRVEPEVAEFPENTSDRCLWTTILYCEGCLLEA